MDRKIKKTFVVGLLSFAVLCSGGGAAYADSTRVNGELNNSGVLVKYDYTRTKTFDGNITLTVDDMPKRSLTLGLRNMKKPGGPKFHEDRKWTATGTKSWGNVLKETKFAFQGKMEACTTIERLTFQCDNKWGGELTY